jgi:hypothetical protein
VPHEAPSVTRVQGCVSVVTTLVQVPPLHLGVVTVRVCVPLVPHALAKPPHAPHAP